MQSLQEIYLKYSKPNADGHGDKGTAHSYIPEYERLFTPYRDKQINFLEIGLAYGESLEMWYEYFSKESKIHGVDVSTREIYPYLTDKRFNISIADASKSEMIDKLGKTKFDLIIDDGSHKFDHQVASFNLLKNSMNKGGLYIVEDVINLDLKRKEFESLHSKCEIIDLRPIKGRKDDVLIVYKF